MDTNSVPELAPAVLIFGLAAWISLTAYNNLRSFGHGAGYVGHILKMEGLRMDGIPDSPLTSRAQHDPRLHRIGISGIILIQAISGAFLWIALINYGLTTPLIDPVAMASLALTVFMAMTFVLLLGGSWYAFYIYLEQSQIMHFMMIAVAIGGLILLKL
ncbi:DUF2165 domain-containing protein (plasmid) [Leisingera sp. M527]|uniref:DUF2165 domain-containing protein n=1 Tax=Leisingera sp. M527 TaxID=2867014 RepID=UPI0021A56EEE|nr:DUF2165 domain-containing protein [Leisingera sp. M527]UWQ35432.1 DUF2165 domain-containing protein [Leisingera sp. M527]